MKKLFMVGVLGLALGITGVFAQHPGGLGIGIQGGYGLGGGETALSLKVPSLPVYWAINLFIGENVFALGVSGDVYLIDTSLVPDIGLGWYFGIGGYGHLNFWGSGSGHDGVGIGLGARLPVGLSWFIPGLPIPLELYLQAHVGLGIIVGSGFRFPDPSFGGNFGVRVWL
ncbi:MAG: hypothetical protein LBJ41_12100 [Treponema sp.]|jgi:hypothetical protein|nr:hypothetical protein [Treponema sp.]